MTDYEKLPPHSIESEQSVLGALLQDNDVLDRIAGQIGEEDFYRADHRMIWRQIAQIIDANKPADVVTVAEALESTGQLDNSGGMAYLVEIAQNTPAATNIRRYAEIVRSRAIRRNLLAAIDEIGQGIHSGEDIADLLEKAQDRIMSIGDKSQAHAPVHVTEIARERLNVLDERFAGNDDGLSTGLTNLDDKLGKIRPGDLVVIAGRPGMGKAQPLDAKILRYDGTWIRMGDIRVGDKLASIDAGGATVSCIHPRGERQVFRVTLSDGRATECCADHLWTVMYRTWNAPRTIDTKKLVEMLSRKRYQGRLSIGMVSGDFGNSCVPLDPYVLGVLLGDGNFSGSGVRLTSADEEIVLRVSERLGKTVDVKRVVGNYAYSLSSRFADGRDKETVLRNGIPYYERNIYPVIDALESLGLRGLTSESKFIPDSYLSSDRESRLDLLRGLLDTDGWAEVHGSIGFSSCSKLLATGVQSLVRSLGGVCQIKEKQTSFTTCKGGKKAGRTAYLCRIRHLHGEELFSLERKSSRAVRIKNGVSLTIKNIEPTRVCDTQCITVNRDDGLYVTDDYIVTHNSAYAMQMLRSMATAAKPGLFISLEMSAGQLVDRMLSSEGRINLKKFRTAEFHDDDWYGLTVAIGKINDIPLYIDDHSNSLGQIMSTMRAFKRRHGLGVVAIDYIGLVESSGDTREQEIARITRALKLASKRLGCPIIALSQLNRKLEDRADKRPVMSDLRECLPIDEWVDTPTGPVQLKTRPGTIITADEDGSKSAECSFIEKRYNSTYRVKTRFGSFSATARHHVLTGTGWKQVRDLVPGRDVVACPKKIPHANRGSIPHGRLLGWLIGNGHLENTPSLVYRNELDADVREAVGKFGVDVKPRSVQRSSNVTEVYLSNGVESGCLPNPLTLWIRELGLYGVLSNNKTIPEQYLGSSDETHIELLKGLWETDGTVTGGVAKFASSSETLSRQVKWLLHTIGVRSTVNYETNNYGGIWSVSCSTEDNSVLKMICGNTLRFGKLSEPSDYYVDPSPAIFVELAEEIYSGQKRLQRRANGDFKQISKARMLDILSECYISTIADSPYMTMRDMGWASITSIEKDENEIRVCDLHVPGTHCFITNGLVVHNSGAIEQDADSILMLYRDEIYNPDSEHKGICEVLIRKNRHGETGVVPVSFRADIVKFEDYNGTYSATPYKPIGRRKSMDDL